MHGILGVLLVLVETFALAEPGSTFEALAAVIGSFFSFEGVFDATVAFATKGDLELGWLQLPDGLVEVGLPFRVAGDLQRTVTLPPVSVAVVRLSKGISALFLAFELRDGRKEREPA